MKYSLAPLPTVERDFAHPRPEALPSYGRVIGGLLVFVGCLSWSALFLALGA